jgi:hypothetical protein
MKSLTRLTLFAAACLTTLALAAPAMAAYTTPRLTILNPSEAVGGGGPLTITASQSKDDDATFRVTFYVPQGYVSSLVPQVGQTIGEVNAQINATAISADAIVPVSGAITAADPAAYRRPQDQGCAGAGVTYDAVYLLNMTAAGQTLQVPMYVTPITSGPEATFASGKLTACLPPPQTAQLGAKLISASLRFNGIFTNPSTRGRYTWRALWTPYNGTTPNAAGSVETQAVDGIGTQLVTRATYNRRTKRMTVSGSITDAGNLGVSAVNVRLRIGGRITRVARTNSRGSYSVSFRWTRKGAIGIAATASRGVASVNGCSTPTFPGVSCLATNTSSFSLSRRATVRVR